MAIQLIQRQDSKLEWFSLSKTTKEDWDKVMILLFLLVTWLHNCQLWVETGSHGALVAAALGAERTLS